MRGFIRLQSANWLCGGLHLLIAAAAAQSESREAWLIALPLMSALSFFAWIANYRRLRHIDDTPTSNVASAAQGYVELAGRAAPLPGTPLLCPWARVQCCWYRYQVERRASDHKWSFEEADESDDPFLLVDATGECLVDPAGAEIFTHRKQVTTDGDYRYTEWLIVPRDPLYAIGRFATAGGPATPLDVSADLSALLTEWKRDRPGLLGRFDANRDGQVDMREWEAARQAARQEIERQHRELRAGNGTHTLSKPEDGRPYLISNHLPESLARRFRIWSWVHIAIFIGAGAAALFIARLT